MTDRHDEAEEIRAETAENSPELQEHDQFAELQAQLEEAQAKALYAAADLFLLPSVHDHAGNVDGLPNTLLEAMATGLPIVASDVVGVPTVIDNGVEGMLVPEGDVAALGAAIGGVLGDPARAAALGRAARARVERELTWPQIARRYLAVYREAIGRTARRRGGGR